MLGVQRIEVLRPGCEAILRAANRENTRAIFVAHLRATMWQGARDDEYVSRGMPNGTISKREGCDGIARPAMRLLGVHGQMCLVGQQRGASSPPAPRGFRWPRSSRRCSAPRNKLGASQSGRRAGAVPWSWLIGGLGLGPAFGTAPGDCGSSRARPRGGGEAWHFQADNTTKRRTPRGSYALPLQRDEPGDRFAWSALVRSKRKPARRRNSITEVLARSQIARASGVRPKSVWHPLRQ